MNELIKSSEEPQTPDSPIDNRVHYVYTPEGIIPFTQQEKALVDCFIATADMETAAMRAGMTKDAATFFLQGPKMETYLKKTVDDIARKNSVTFESVASRLHQVAFGSLQVSKLELKALEMLGKLLQFIKPPEAMKVAVIQNNTTNAAPAAPENPHPFSEYTDERIEAMLKDRIIDAEVVSESQQERQTGAA